MAQDATFRENPASVGYRRPPAGVRFQKGQSGNPAGKRKGSKNKSRSARAERLKSLMLQEAYRPITVTQDGKAITMPMAQAVLRALAVAAVKGETRAQAMFIKIVSATEEDEAAIEEMLTQAREETGTAEPADIVCQFVDAADGRPTGKTEIANFNDLYPKA